jgi:hypothetical protein
MPREEGLLPDREQLANEPAHDELVDRALADDLVRNRDVPAARVVDLRNVHSGSLTLIAAA